MDLRRFFINGVLATSLAALPHGTLAEDHCSRETLEVRGTNVTISYCLSAQPQHVSAQEIAIPVDGTYSAPGGSYSRSAVLHFVAGEGPSRVLQNVELAPLGLSGTLHLTLVYSGGTIHIEGALLTPGAVTIK